MISAQLTALTEHTYSRSDFAYRISLVRELLEYTFFTKRDVSVRPEGVEAFAIDSKKSVADLAFLRTLPHTFFEAFTQDSFYTTLEQLTLESEHLKTLSLTLPVALARTDIEAIGVWARREVNPGLLMTIDIDQAVAVGCRVGWNNQLHDYSFEHFVAAHQSALEERYAQVTPVASTA